MRRTHLTAALIGTLALALTGALVSTGRAEEKEAPKPVRMSLRQARQSVAMLNDLYVNAVVLTHATYVKDPGTPAAAAVARKVFKAMAEKGWPQTRWLSTTGRPFNPDANPKDQFEKDAVAALKSGKTRFERIENGENGQLRVVTLVPLVDPSCQMCHTRDKVGDPIGGLSYTVLLSEKQAASR